MTTASGRLRTGDDYASSVALGAGGVRWLGETANFDLANVDNDGLDALLVTIK
jgi:hypothetical protein